MHPLLGRHLRRHSEPIGVLAVPSPNNHQRHRRGGPARMRVPGAQQLGSMGNLQLGSMGNLQLGSMGRQKVDFTCVNRGAGTARTRTTRGSSCACRPRSRASRPSWISSPAARSRSAVSRGVVGWQRRPCAGHDVLEQPRSHAVVPHDAPVHGGQPIRSTRACAQENLELADALVARYDLIRRKHVSPSLRLRLLLRLRLTLRVWFR